MPQNKKAANKSSITSIAPINESVPTLSIVVPAHNEEQYIARTLSNYADFFQIRKNENTLNIEIIVVINDSDDATLTKVSKYNKQYPFINVYVTPYHSGKGGAIALGFSKASGDYIGYVDADGSISATSYFELFEFIKETPWLDGVVGNRGKSIKWAKFSRRVYNKYYQILSKHLLGLPYKDVSCGAKIFKHSAAKEIARKVSFTKHVFDANLLVLSRHLNYRIIEKDIEFKDKSQNSINLILDLTKLKFQALRLRGLEYKYLYNRTLERIVGHKVRSPQKETKNILIYAWRDIKHPEMGGSEIYIHEVAKRLAKKHNVTLFTSHPANVSERDEIDGIEIVRRGGMFTVYIWAFIYYFVYFRKDMDLIIDVQNGIPFFTPLFSAKPKILLIHHVHNRQWFVQMNFFFAIVGFIIEMFLTRLMYFGVPVVTVSPSTLGELKKLGFDDRHIYIGYNSIPSKVGKKVPKTDFPSLLYVGRVKAYKRIEKAIDAVYKLKNKYPDIKLDIAGSGDHLDDLKRYVNKKSLEKHVKFHGFVSDYKKWELLQRSWVFVMPSMQEGWGITIIEAASTATPAVGYNVAGVRDSIKDHATGLLAHSDKNYIELVDYLLSDKKYREQLGSQAVVWAKMFSWRKTVEVFNQVMKVQDSADGLLEDTIYPWELDLGVEFMSKSFAQE